MIRCASLLLCWFGFFVQKIINIVRGKEEIFRIWWFWTQSNGTTEFHLHWPDPMQNKYTTQYQNVVIKYTTYLPIVFQAAHADDQDSCVCVRYFFFLLLFSFIRLFGRYLLDFHVFMYYEILVAHCNASIHEPNFNENTFVYLFAPYITYPLCLVHFSNSLSSSFWLSINLGFWFKKKRERDEKNTHTKLSLCTKKWRQKTRCECVGYRYYSCSFHLFRSQYFVPCYLDFTDFDEGFFLYDCDSLSIFCCIHQMLSFF